MAEEKTNREINILITEKKGQKRFMFTHKENGVTQTFTPVTLDHALMQFAYIINGFEPDINIRTK